MFKNHNAIVITSQHFSALALKFEQTFYNDCHNNVIMYGHVSVCFICCAFEIEFSRIYINIYIHTYIYIYIYMYRHYSIYI